MTLADRVVVMNKGEIQQVGTPTDIYDTPSNTFVAGFIGSPAMNLFAGELSGGVFRAENMEIAGLPTDHNGPVELGFRAEDASVTNEGGNAQISAPIYTVELLGDATMVTVRAGGGLASVKTGKEYRAEIGEGIGIEVRPDICHLFDQKSGQRLAMAA